jgi:drug/metabolite transporter (DMT)-like permease
LRTLPDNRIGAMVLGLLIALGTGSALLLAMFGSRIELDDASFPTIAAGVLTFPMATGIYYVASIAFRGRAEVAAQFSQLKPLISVLLAAVALDEPVRGESWLSVVLVGAGLGLLVFARLRGHVTAIAVTLGLMLASLWALGEAAIAASDIGTRGIEQTTVALLAGTIIGVAFGVPALLFVGLPSRGRWMLYFALHGVLSFGLAYALYFEAIRRLGLGPTALINAFWPMLALFLGHMLARRRDRAAAIPQLIWAAAILLLCGSIAAIWGEVTADNTSGEAVTGVRP